MEIALFILGIVWIFTFLILSPDWQTLLSYLPICIYALGYTENAYKPWYLLIIIPFSVIAIQVLENSWKFKGIWQYLAWLPGVMVLATFALNFSNMHFPGSLLSNIWLFVVCSICFIFLGKIWLGKPLLLLINRLYIIHNETINYKLSALKAKRNSRAFSFYIISTDTAENEVSGFVFTYLRWKGLGNGGTVTFNFKTGWLGVSFASGFPQVSRA